MTKINKKNEPPAAATTRGSALTQVRTELASVKLEKTHILIIPFQSFVFNRKDEFLWEKETQMVTDV